MNKFKDLIVWQKSIDLTVDIYNLTAKLPYDEKYGLRSQLNRAVVSIPSNISEGAGRNSNKEFIQYLGYSQGSASEVVTQLIVCHQLKMLGENDIIPAMEKLEHIQRMITALQKSKTTIVNRMYNLIIVFSFLGILTLLLR